MKKQKKRKEKERKKEKRKKERKRKKWEKLFSGERKGTKRKNNV